MTEIDTRPSRVPVDLTTPLADLDQAWRLAHILAMSNVVPVALRNNAANVLIIMMTGHELGLTVAQSLRSVFVSQSGMPGLRGEMMLAKLRQAGHDYEWDDSDPDCTVFRLIRKDGRTYSASFSLDDALAAQLVSRGKDGELIALSQYGKPLPWMLYRPDLLFWRAATRCVRRGAPEVLLGMSVAEAAESDDQAVPRVLPQVQDAGGTPQPAAPDMQVVRAEVLDLDAEMTPVAGDDTRNRPDETAGAETTAVFPSGDAPAGSPEAAAEAGGGESPTRRNAPRSAGSASSRGAQAPPPQGPEADWETEVQQAFDDLAREERHAAATRAVAASVTPAENITGSQKHLAGRFTTMGWPPDQYAANVLHAASLFARRKLGSLQELNAAQAGALNAALSKLITKHKNEPDMYPVILADAVTAWEEAWRLEDPDGYAAAGYK